MATEGKAAKLRHLAAVEDVDYRTPRGLDRAMFMKLASCDWIRERRHCFIVVGMNGPTASRARIGTVSNQDRSRL